MPHILLTQVNKCRDGVLISLDADSRERRIKALEATRRACFTLADDITRELVQLTKDERNNSDA